MNIFKWLSRVYILFLIKSLMVSSAVASGIAIFFGFFSESWFNNIAFWGFFIPMAIFAFFRCLRERSEMKPFVDVTSIFDKNASSGQKKRGLKALMEEDEEYNEDDMDENQATSNLAETRELINQVITLIKEANLPVTSFDMEELVEDHSEFNEEDKAMIVDTLLHQLIGQQRFSWYRELNDDEDEITELYTEILQVVRKYCPELALTCQSCQWDPETKQVTIKLTVKEEDQTWVFTDFGRDPADNFLIHLNLLLKVNQLNTLHYCDEQEEYFEILLLPLALVNTLTQTYSFNLNREW